MLERGSIHVWSFALDHANWAAERVAEWRSLLSPEEVIRAEMFRGEDHRRDYIAAHATLRFVLGLSLGIGCREVRLAANEATHGSASRSKPTLSKDGLHGTAGAGLDLRFNLSHTRGAAMVAVANGLEVGVDVEWHRPLDDLDGMAETVMSAGELKVWKAIADAGDSDEVGKLGKLGKLGNSNKRSLAFYNLWTRKESYLKAIGLGLYRDLHEVTVPVSAERLGFASSTEYEAVAVKDTSGSGIWRVLDLPVKAGYSASLCFEAGERFEGRSLPVVVVAELDLDRVV